MSLPTETQVRTYLFKWILAFEKLYVQLTNVSAGWPARAAAGYALFENDSPEVAQAEQLVRNQLSDTLTVNAFRQIVDPILRTYGRVKGYPDTDVVAILDKLILAYGAAGQTIQARNLAYGTVSQSGTGTGNLYRYTRSRYNYNLETPPPEAKVLKCVQDASNGAAQHEEIFQYTGAAAGRDLLDIRGSGTIFNVRAYSARDSLINNPSFSIVTGTTPTVTSLVDWTLDSGTLPVVDGTNYFRGFQGDTTPYAAKFAADASISQLLSVRGASFDPLTPYNLIVAYNRSTGSGTGTLTITVGDSTVSVNLTTASSGWNRVTLNLSSSDLWFANFNASNPVVRIAISGSSGYTLIDDVLLVPGTNLDGTYFFICGGATKFLMDDQFSWLDSNNDAEYGIIQRWMNRKYGRSFPSSLSPTFADPS